MTTPAPSLDDLDEQLWPLLARLARAMHVPNAELQPTLDAIVAHATATVLPAEHAGLILLLRGRLEPQSTLGEPPQILDALQQKVGTGPCIDAARDQAVVLVEDMAAETRWPGFGEQALTLGVASMLCVPLWVDRTRLGTLSLYGAKPHAFSPHDLRLTELFATHAALALADAQRAASLQAALGNRDVIGQAKGILIERLKVTPEAAFEQLSRVSQNANMKLIAVAQYLVHTGELPRL